MRSVFCPGHISCIFRPERTGNPITTGSRGLGIRLDSGSHVRVSRRDDEKVVITMNGSNSGTEVTRSAIALMDAGVGFDVSITHDLPVSQGFGTSASGTLGACLCIADLMGFPTQLANMCAHIAEVNEGGGLGDVAAILSGYDVPIRATVGIPPDGCQVNSGLVFEDLSLIVFDGCLETAPIINDPELSDRIAIAGDESMRMFESDISVDGLFRASNAFSESIGLETDEIKSSMESIRSEGYRSGMCMLGNSIFSEIPLEKAKKMFPSARVYSCSSSSSPISVNRKA